MYIQVLGKGHEQSAQSLDNLCNSRNIELWQGVGLEDGYLFIAQLAAHHVDQGGGVPGSILGPLHPENWEKNKMEKEEIIILLQNRTLLENEGKIYKNTYSKA